MPKRPVHTETWAMPEWMEKYRACIANVGRNRVEDYMVDKNTVFNNLPRYIAAVCVKAQVAMLTRLHDQGILP